MEAYTEQYLKEVVQVANAVDREQVNRIVELLVELRDSPGRLFLLGVGGGAGNASHAVNDFRKIAGIEAYAPTDNVSELTARVNDEGWEGAYAEWLKVSRLSRRDMVLLFSVSGGDPRRGVSLNLVRALELAGAR